MKRIILDGRCLGRVRHHVPAQWLKVYVPDPMHDRSHGRAYTIRRFSEETGALMIDFALHDDSGPVTAWAIRAEAGDHLQISDPHPSSGLIVDAGVEQYIFFGDATALPAIASILEALPKHATAQAIIEIDDIQDKQVIKSQASVEILWQIRPQKGEHSQAALSRAALKMRPLSRDCIVWMAGESAEIKSLREIVTLMWHIPQHRLHAMGYWKRGKVDYRDPS